MNVKAANAATVKATVGDEATDLGSAASGAQYETADLSAVADGLDDDAMDAMWRQAENEVVRAGTADGIIAPESKDKQVRQRVAKLLQKHTANRIMRNGGVIRVRKSP